MIKWTSGCSRSGICNIVPRTCLFITKVVQLTSCCWHKLRLRGTWIAETVLLTYRLKEMWHADTTAVLLCCLVRTWAVIAVSRSSEMIPDPDGHWSTQTGQTLSIFEDLSHTHINAAAWKDTLSWGDVETLECAVISVTVCTFAPPQRKSNKLSNEQI